MTSPGEWWAVAFSADLAPKSLQLCDIGVKRVLLYRGASGRVYATDALSPHGYPLVESEVNGDSLHCRIDDTMWDLDSGLPHHAAEDHWGMVLVAPGEVPGHNGLPSADGADVTITQRRSTETKTSAGLVMECLCDPTLLRYVLGAESIEGPSVEHLDRDRLRLRYRADYVETSKVEIDVHLDSTGLIRLLVPGSGASFAATPIKSGLVYMRVAVGARPSVGQRLELDWSRVVDRHFAVVDAIAQGRRHNLTKDERRVADALQTRVGGGE